MSEKSLALKLTEVLFEHDPKISKGDIESVALAAANVADVLGCLMSLAKAQITDAAYQNMIGSVRDRIDRSTNDIEQKAAAMRERRDGASLQ